MIMQNDGFLPSGISLTINQLTAAGIQFAVATVVRTVSVTAAKPGAKAIIDENGHIIEGWIGGGCVKRAVTDAAKKAMRDGKPKLVAIQPEELLAEQGLNAGEVTNGVFNASNLCPSKGSMDIFIEPVIANPELLIFGMAPVATVLTELAESFSFNLNHVVTKPEKNTDKNKSFNSIESISESHSNRYIIVATQGNGDLNALKKALSIEHKHIGFVGSPRKMAHLKKKLRELNFQVASIEKIKGPAGINIGSVTPHEIALSILAELVALRRTNSIPVLVQ